ncbi:MAG TPA: hypothetical protein VN541_14620 [Tepidisphaeraceae bacterium]|nr:hypothetical protein [Tepidisphaeraceae bacterium]
MNSRRSVDAVRTSGRDGLETAIRPATSEVPPALPAEFLEELRPHPAASQGGLDNIPEDLLPPAEQLKDELNHAGLDAELPEEDRAPLHLLGPMHAPPPPSGKLHR